MGCDDWLLPLSALYDVNEHLQTADRDLFVLSIYFHFPPAFFFEDNKGNVLLADVAAPGLPHLPVQMPARASVIYEAAESAMW